MVAYRAGKRCVLFDPPTESGRSGVFHKVYRRPPTPHRVAYLKNIRRDMTRRSAGRVQMPEILDYSEDDRRMVLSEVPPPCRPGGFGSTDTALAGMVLAELHAGTQDASLSIHSPQAELETVARWQALAAAMRLAEGESASDTLERLSAIMPAEGSDLVIVHRDFFPAQLMWHQVSAWLLDFDTLCLGHPEVDFGTYVAHVYLERLIHNSADASIRGILQEMRTSYEARGGGLDAFRLRYYLACAVFRLSAIQRTRHGDPRVVSSLRRTANELMVNDPDKLRP